MQAIKEKLQGMNPLHKAKADAKAREKEDKELAKAKMDIACEVRLAKEAEAEMDLHVARAGKIAEREIAKHAPLDQRNNANYNPSDGTAAPGDPMLTMANTTDSDSAAAAAAAGVGAGPNCPASAAASRNNLLK